MPCQGQGILVAIPNSNGHRGPNETGTCTMDSLDCHVLLGIHQSYGALLAAMNIYIRQDPVGTYHNGPLRRFDFVLATMAKIGLRAIIPLTNWWPQYGGQQWCVSLKPLVVFLCGVAFLSPAFPCIALQFGASCQGPPCFHR
jgi:hypothetical protein